MNDDTSTSEAGGDDPGPVPTPSPIEVPAAATAPAAPPEATTVLEPAPLEAAATAPAPEAAASSARPPRTGGARARRTVRRSVTWLLILLTAVGVLGTSLAFWADRTIFSESAYLAIVGPIAQDPAVVSSMSTQVSEAIVTKLDIEQKVADALPGPSAALAGLVASGIQSTMERAIAEFMTSPQFGTVWIEANRALHAQLVKVLHGESTALQTSDGVVYLNAFPLVAKALDAAGTALAQAIGHPVPLPTLTDPSNPDASRAELEQALGRSLPSDFGVIPVAETQALQRAQAAVWLFETSIIVSALLTLLLAVLAVAFAIQRRKALLQVVVASGVALAFAGVLVSRVSQLVTDLTPSGAAAVLGQVTISRVMEGFESFAFVLVVIAVVIGIALYLAGRPAWIPRYGSSLAKRVGVAPSGNPFVRFVAEHIGELRFAGYAIAIVGLLLVPVGNGSVVGTLVALVVYQVVLTVVRAFRPAYIRSAEDAV